MASPFNVNYQSPTFRVKGHLEDITKLAEIAQSIPGQESIPYINIIERVLMETEQTFNEINDRIDIYESEFSDPNGEIQEKQASLFDSFEHAFLSFDRLKFLFESINNEMISMGNELQILHDKKVRSLQVIELIQYFMEFVSGKSTGQLESQLQQGTISSGSSKTKAAEILKKLCQMSKANIPNIEGGRMLIEGLAEKFENELLQRFHLAFEQGNLQEMRLSAATLISFNGGHSCIQSFISQHNFFDKPIEAESLRTRYHPSNPLVSIILSEPEPLDPIISHLYASIIETVEADWKYVEAVFEDPIMVMDALIARIFHEPVQVYIEETLRQAKKRNPMAHLRTMYVLYKEIMNVSRRIASSYDGRLAKGDYSTNSNSLSNSNFPSFLTEKRGNENENENGINSGNGNFKSLLVRQDSLFNIVMTLFSPFIGSSSSYIEYEQKTLIDLLTLSSSPLRNFLVNHRQKMSSILSRTGLISSSISISASMSSSSNNAGNNSNFGSGSAFYSSALNSNIIPVEVINAMANEYVFMANGEIPLISPNEGGDGIPSLEVIKRTLILHAEASSRCCMLLLEESAKKEAMETLFQTFIQNMIVNYCEVALDSALELDQFGTATEIGYNPHHFVLVEACAKIMIQVQRYFEVSLTAVCIEISPECYKSLALKKNLVFDRIKDKSESLLNRELLGIVDWIVNKTLIKQKKSDFRPRNDDLELLNDISGGCQQTVDFLKSFNQTLKRLIVDNEQMIFNFLQELSNEFFLVLIEHLKKFTISDSGAVILRNDLRMYAEILGLLHDKSKIRDKQDFLSELGNIFLVKPENLKALMQEGILSLIDPKLIYNLVMQRADFKSASVETFFPEMNSTFSFGTRFFD